MTNVHDTELLGDFKLLRDACIDLQTLANEFRALFENDDKPTLDAVSCAGFDVIYKCMVEAWWLRVGRLSDPVAGLGQPNLSFKNIISRTRSAFGDDAEIDESHEKLRAVFNKMKASRDKQVAHADLKASRDGVWLSSISESEADAIENEIQVLCDLLGRKLGEGPLDFRASGCTGDANDLVAFLKFGLRARDAWHKSNPNSQTAIRGMYRD